MSSVNRLRITRIRSIEPLAPKVKLITFQDPLCARAKPGQFLMIWIPGVDEIPISISMIGLDDVVGIAVAEVGEATRSLNSREKGDKIGIRGPYGNSFSLIKGNALIVGGGTGIAPLAFLAEQLIGTSNVTFIAGAKGREDLLFLDRLRSILSRPGSKLIITTEDGSYGIKGLASGPVEELLRSGEFHMVYTCGKELLMHKVFQLAEKWKVPMQASLERYMKCAMGICGQCVLDPLGLLVCKDGPVFSNDVLRRTDDFGKYTRDPAGRKIELKATS